VSKASTQLTNGYQSREVQQFAGTEVGSRLAITIAGIDENVV
jgi:hypothetical protein